jgi:AcrR family transcriptional regulator
LQIQVLGSISEQLFSFATRIAVETGGVSEGRLRQRKIPQQRRAAATIASILEAAARILEEGGVEAYNTNAVARLAGISVGSLYQYFPNKDAVTRALIDREASSLLMVLERIAGSGGGDAGIREMVSAIVTHLMCRPNLARLLDVQEQKLSLQDLVLRSETQVHSLLRAGLAGASYAALPDEATMLWDVIGIIRGMVDGAVANGERDIANIAGRVERAVMAYLAASAGAAR